LRHRGLAYYRHLRWLTHGTRTAARDATLGWILCFVAGALNAGGFLVVGQYTSHMTGIVSAVADNIAAGQFTLVWAGLASLLAFVAGSACSTLLIVWGRDHFAPLQYTLPLLVEAALLIAFGGLAFVETKALQVALAIPLLCFIMGLQNAIITKISQARIRTTHVTGLTTDIGIELGRLTYFTFAGTRQGTPEPDLGKLRLLVSLLASFVGGGIVGAYGFNSIGFLSTLPLALILLVLSGLPVLARLRS
jgi:uncharacterized membrane protein YoaK (UPF0700 family)